MTDVRVTDADDVIGEGKRAARVALDAQLRTELGRRLTLVLLWAPEALNAPTTTDANDATDEAMAPFQAELAAYHEVRLLTVDAHGAPVSTATQTRDAKLEAALRTAFQMDADAVLIWQGAQTTPMGTPDDADEREWLRAVVAIAERLNLFDAATLALIGPSVSRAQARALGYEDGFALTEPLADAVHAALERLTHEALARAEYRHKGSSPPCYL
ncbi:MAG TPA: hypothetical protein VMV29_07075 [Ktedonobacterales bacterium]|nr:hypothetical protein [Ktedonobacterales bacterium]